MGKKSMKKVTRIAVAFLVVMMVFVLSGCEKDGDKFVKELEPLVEKLETAAKAGNSEDYRKVYVELEELTSGEKYAKLTKKDYSDESYKTYELLQKRIPESNNTLIGICLSKDINECIEKIEAAVLAENNYAYEYNMDVYNDLIKSSGKSLSFLPIGAKDNFDARIAAAEESIKKVHIIIPEENLVFKLNSAGTSVIIIGQKNWKDSWKKRILEIPTTIQGMPVKEIGDNYDSNNAVFNYYCYCEGIIIPDGINLKTEAFEKFPGKFVRLPTTLKEIPKRCFSSSSIESIEIPKSVKEIGTEAFAYCKNLKEIIIPENVEKINAEAFYDSGIQSLTLPKSVSFAHNVFYCNNLTAVEIPEGVSSYFKHQDMKSRGYNSATNLSEIISGDKLPLSTVSKLKQIKLVEK